MKSSTVAMAKTLAALKQYLRFGLELLDDRIVKVTGFPIPSSFFWARSLNSRLSRFAVGILRRSHRF
jgi:hypothetical protein